MAGEKKPSGGADRRSGPLRNRKERQDFIPSAPQGQRKKTRESERCFSRSERIGEKHAEGKKQIRQKEKRGSPQYVEETLVFPFRGLP